MAGQSIGELFVNLGFEVDDKKLKSFDESLQGVVKTAMNLAGVAGGAYGFYELAKGAEQNALSIEKLTAIYGVSAKAIQAWGAVVHETWPDITYAAGISQFGKIAEYLNNAAISPTGVFALSRLGVHYTTADRQHPEKALDQLFDTIPKLLAEHPNQRGLYSKLVGDITGDPANISIFERGRGAAGLAASHTQLYQDELDKTVAMSRQIAGLQDQWDRFVNHVMASLAGLTLGLEDHIKKDGVLAGIGKWVDDLGASDPYGLTSAGKSLIHNGVTDNLSQAAANHIENASANQTDSLTFWESHGYEPAQVAAWLAQEKSESSFGSAKNMNKNGHFGAFQWSKERADEILAGTGIDVRTANHWQQLKAADWEFRKMGLDNAFRNLHDRSDASEYLSKKFEVHEKWNPQHGDEAAYRAKMAENMPVPDVHVVQNIHSNADADEVARVSNQGLNDTITAAFLNRIGVSQ